MPWIGSSRHARPETLASESSLEYATTVDARGISPASAVIETLTASECRLRTVVLFDMGQSVGFDFAAPGQEKVRAQGCVVERKMNGPRFIYRLKLDRMPARQTDLLARAVAETYRRQARSRAQERAIQKLPTTDGLQRASVRVMAQFPVVYRTAREKARSAKAGDVSTGGLAMTCGEALIAGEIIELRFALPSEALEIHPEQTAILDLHTRAVRHARSDMRRPFEEMVLRARVASHQPLGNGTYKYGLAFLETSNFEREELARYVHAVQLAKRKIAR